LTRPPKSQDALDIEVVEHGLVFVDARKRELRVQPLALAIVGVDVDRLIGSGTPRQADPALPG
jgi:hypothetical protein